jgi:hypothetical protein
VESSEEKNDALDQLGQSDGNAWWPRWPCASWICGGHDGHHGYHHTTGSPRKSRPNSSTSDSHQNGPSSKCPPKQKEPTSDNQKKEASSKDPPPGSNEQKRRDHRRNSKLVHSFVSKPTSSPRAALQHFIITVPLMFPPTNDAVEPHEYFDKWKTVDSEAFVGVDGDELTELLLRGLFFSFFDVCLFHYLMILPNLFILLIFIQTLFYIMMYASYSCYHGMNLLIPSSTMTYTHPASKKAKFFFHPDKLPKDLTDNQAQLFKTLWNELQEKEALLQK